jgi:uncharacterized protein (TIGR01777 family)
MRFVQWNPSAPTLPAECVEACDGILNLAGEPIAARRWSQKQKTKILESRCDATRALVQAAARAARKPRFFINASAVGYYGPRGDEPVTEKDAAGEDFLARTCLAWETEARRAEEAGIRVVRLRIGIVLALGGGALAKMIPPFRFFLGGPLGSGRQWMSWIHREDLTGLILFLMGREISGPVNATAPNPVRMKEFAQTLGRTLKRPARAPVPAFMLRFLLGEMSEMLLEGQRVVPEQALSLGYRFRFPRLEEALEDLIVPSTAGGPGPKP